MKRTTITLLYDGSPGGTSRYYVTVTIGGIDRPLGSHATGTDAATAMGKWVHDRGLVFAPDSARRLAEAKRLDADVLILDVWTAAAYAEHVEARRTAWQSVEYDPYIHTAYRMTAVDVFPWLNESPAH